MSDTQNTSVDSATAEALRTVGELTMPPGVAARLHAVIADEIRDRLLNDRPDEMPAPNFGPRDFPNPPAHYNASGLGLHRPATNGC